MELNDLKKSKIFLKLLNTKYFNKLFEIIKDNISHYIINFNITNDYIDKLLFLILKIKNQNNYIT